MGNFKYKIKELNVGDVEIDKGTKYTVRSIDPETGSISWSVEKVGDYTSALEELHKAKKFFDELIASPEAKGDIKIRQIATQVRELFNDYRTHLRKNYPEEYKKVSSLSEESTIASNSGFISGGEGENHNGLSSKKSTYGAYTQAGYKKVNEGPGATLGPGPKAGPEGVKDNMYVKKFKYKLVDKKKLNKAAKGIDWKGVGETLNEVKGAMDKPIKHFEKERV